MLSNLFKGRNPLAAARAEKRLGAIAALTAEKAEKLRDEINACARDDADTRVRKAALAWVDDPALLEDLLADDAIVESAAARLAELGANIDHPAVRLAKTRTAQSAEAALRATRGVSAPEQLAPLFLACPERHREALLPGLRALGERGLSMLERESRNHDKQVNRTARTELDTLRNAKRAVDELSQRAAELRAALERETAGTSSTRPLQLRRALEECVRGVRDQANSLVPYGLEIPDVEDWLPPVEEPDRPVPEPELAESKPEQTNPGPEPVEPITRANEPGFAALASESQSLDERMVAGESVAALKETHDDLASRWLAAADHTQPDEANKAIFDSASHRFHELAEATDRLQNIDLQSADAPPELAAWPEEPDELQALWQQLRGLERSRDKLQRQLVAIAWPDWAPEPHALGAVATRIATLDDFVRRLGDHQQSLENKLAGLIEKTGADVEEGHLKSAQSNLGAARKITRLLPEPVARRHRKSLIAVAVRVDEMQDWQSFATSPKRRELLDSMKALAAEIPANAKDQADRIKALRNEWNTLGHVSGSGGRAMHAQFNRYAERAFEPCRAYFNEQAELRKENLAQRRLICEQLQEYVDNVDWANADMRAAEQIMRAARNEWRAHHPVDRRHAKPLETRFEQLQERIFGHVKSVWEANLEAKRAIVAAAEQLASGQADIEEKVRGAKALQRQWQAVGMTPRNPDQKLWRQFREQCDRIFEARESKHTQVRNERDSSIADAETICDNMRTALAEAERDPAKADRATLARLRAELYAIKMPERVERSLHKRFDDIARSYNQLILAGEIDVLCEELNQLKAWDVEVSAAEAEGRAIPPPAPCFANRPADADEPLPTLHRLTLEAELQAGVESPPEDRQLRLEVQVEALNQSMGRRAAEKEPRELAEAWCQLGPKSEASDVLRERFFAAVLKLARPYR